MYPWSTPLVRQSWTTSGVLWSMLGQGMVLSYPSCLLPAILSGEDQIHVDLHTASWLASSVGISAIFGNLVSSYLMERLGRRITHAILTIPGIVGWLLIYFSYNVTTLMTGIIFGGITGGGTLTLGAIVIGEYTSPEHRGMFLNMKTVAVCLGNTIVHIIGFYFHWKTVALLALAPFILSLIVVGTWPESPAWLASKEQFENSEKAFYWLRGHNTQSKKELDDIIKAQKERLASQIYQTCVHKTIEVFKKFLRKDFLKPVSILFLGGILIESCGRHIFPAYAPQIMFEITGDKSQSFYYTLAIDLVITVSATFSSFLVKLLKRRTLLFSTGLGSLVVLAIVCLYLYLVSLDVISRAKTWIPLSLWIMYFILMNQGCAPIPLALLGEILPLVHRGVGSLVAGIWLGICFIIAMKVCPYLLASIGVHGTFTVFGTVMTATLLCLYFILPETKDKTLQEIESYFIKRKISRNRDNIHEKTPDIKLSRLDGPRGEEVM